MTSFAFEGFGAAIVPASAVPVWLGGDWRTIPIDGLAGRSVGLGTRRQGLLSAPRGRCATCCARSSPSGPHTSRASTRCHNT